MAFHFPDDGFAAEYFHDNAHLVAGNDGPAELGLVDTHEVDDRLCQIGVLLEQSQNRTRLSHGFNGQYAGHDSRTWKMPIEKRLIDGDILERDDPFIRIDLDDAVDQEKRVSMRKNPHNLGDS